MGFRFRKSIRIAKGVSLNVSKTCLGVSARTKGASISAGTRGVRGTASAPNTGLSYSSRLDSAAGAPPPPPPPRTDHTTRPGGAQTSGQWIAMAVASAAILLVVLACLFSCGRANTSSKPAPSAARPPATSHATTPSQPRPNTTDAPPTQPPAAAPQPPRTETVYVTRTGRKYHRAGCGHLDESAYAATLQQAQAAGYAPCGTCIR